MKKGEWYHAADNTILDCPKASYKYNRSTYERTKFVLLSCAIIVLIPIVIIILCSNDSRVQTGCSVLGGGLLSLIVWLLSVTITDKMAYERDDINRLIYIVDNHLDMLQKNVILEDSQTYKKQELTRDDVHFSFLWLMQNCINLNNDPEIDTSKLYLSWEGQDYTLTEFCMVFEKKMSDVDFLVKLSSEHKDMIVWNFDELEHQLCLLKDKLMRYYSYISSENPPNPYRNK